MGRASLTFQDLVQLYMRAVQNRPAGRGDVAVAAAKDFSKMTPAEKKKELARRRAEAQREKVGLHSLHLEAVVV